MAQVTVVGCTDGQTMDSRNYSNCYDPSTGTFTPAVPIVLTDSSGNVPAASLADVNVLFAASLGLFASAWVIRQVLGLLKSR